MATFAQPAEYQLNEQVRAWFDELMQQLRVDRLSLKTNTATAEKQTFYQPMATANANDMALTSRVQSSQHFLSQLIIDYVTELQEQRVEPQKLASRLDCGRRPVRQLFGENGGRIALINAHSGKQIGHDKLQRRHDGSG